MGEKNEVAFISEAKRLLRQGRPTAALDMLYRFSEIVNFTKEFPTKEYWQLRAVCDFLQGDSTEGKSALNEAGGNSWDFYELYRTSFVAFATRPLPRMRRSKVKHQGLVLFNIGQVIEFAQELGGTGYEVGRDLAELKPRPR